MTKNNMDTMTTGQLVTRLGSEFVTFEEKTEILAELKKRDRASSAHPADRCDRLGQGRELAEKINAMVPA